MLGVDKWNLKPFASLFIQRIEKYPTARLLGIKSPDLRNNGEGRDTENGGHLQATVLIIRQ